MKNKKLAREIIEMAKRDQTIRKAYMKDQSLLEKMEKISQSNLARMKKIVGRLDWPTIPLVGKQASHMAWLVVQHADSDIAFQEHCLELMKEEVKENRVLKSEIAYLTDRVLVNKGKPQMYGTQFYRDKSGKLRPKPIKNMKKLDVLRKVVGLGSFKLYQKEIGG